MKKRLCVILSSTLVLTCGAMAILLNARTAKTMFQKADADVYTLRMDTSHNTLNLSASQSTVQTDSGYDIEIGYSYYSAAADHLIQLNQYGFVQNNDPIHVMNSIKVNYTGAGSLNIRYGFTLPSDLGEQRCMKHTTYALESDALYEFNSEYPAYFLISSVDENAVIIDSIEIKYSCKGDDNRNMSGRYDVTYSNEANAVGYPGYFRYWNARSEWGGPQVNVGAAYATWDKSLMYLGYTVSGGGAHASYGLQIFYKNPSLSTGERYRMSFSAKAKTEKTVTLNGETITIPTTSQAMSVDYTEAGNQASFRLIVGVSDGENGSFQFTGITWSVLLAAPTNVALSDANVLTFTAAPHATSYKAQIVDSSMDPVSELFAVASGDDITSHIPGGLSEGIYYVLVRSEAAGYSDSPWSTNSASFVIGSVDPIPDPSVATALPFGGAAEAVSNAGTMYVWNDQRWCGSEVALNSATNLHRVFTIDYSVTFGACDFGLQLFFKNPTLTAGQVYTLSLTLHSDIATTIRIERGETKQSKDVLADTDTDYELTYTEAADAASLTMCVAVTNGDANVLTVSGITWTPAI